MNKITFWVKKYSTQIIIFLMIVLMLKECKSCSKNRQYQHYKIQYEYNLDSIHNALIMLKDTDTKIINKLSDSIAALQYENKLLKSVMDDVKKDKEYYRKQNNSLTNMANKLVKKDTIK